MRDDHRSLTRGREKEDDTRGFQFRVPAGDTSFPGFSEGRIPSMHPSSPSPFTFTFTRPIDGGAPSSSNPNQSSSSPTTNPSPFKFSFTSPVQEGGIPQFPSSSFSFTSAPPKDYVEKKDKEMTQEREG